MADDLAGRGPFVVGEVALAGNLARLAHCRAGQFPPTPRLGAAAGVGQGRLGIAEQASRGDAECVLHHRQRTLAICTARRVIYSHFGGGVGRRPRVLALPVRVGLGLGGVQVTFGALQTRRFRCGHEPDAMEVGAVPSTTRANIADNVLAAAMEAACMQALSAGHFVRRRGVRAKQVARPAGKSGVRKTKGQEEEGFGGRKGSVWWSKKVARQRITR